MLTLTPVVSTSTKITNSHVAWWMIDQCVQQGIVHVCIAPGSRNTPLSLAAKEHEGVSLHIHYDERGLGFYALRLSAQTNRAALIIVTSGSAVGNLLPAVMEAFHSYLPLIVLSADRPIEEIHSGANQTCEQTNIFGSFVRAHRQFSSISQNLQETIVRSKVAHAVHLAHYIPGPIQINWHIQEPLFTPPFPKLSQGKPIVHHSDLRSSYSKIALSGHGVIVVGKLPQDSDASATCHLAKQLRWPLCSDILAQTRFLQVEEQINHFQEIFKTSSLEVDTILHFGARLTEKKFLSWNVKARRIHVSPWPELQDPSHLTTERYTTSLEDFCSRAQTETTPASWLNLWKQEDQNVAKTLPSLNKEAAAWKALSHIIDPESCLFVGNSMPIRYADFFFHPKNFRGKGICQPRTLRH